MTADIEAIRRMIAHCKGDGRRLANFDPDAVLFAMRALLREVDLLRMDIEGIVP